MAAPSSIDRTDSGDDDVEDSLQGEDRRARRRAAGESRHDVSSQLFIERLEGYEGPVTVQMAATQQRQRRGMRSGTMSAPPARIMSFIRSVCPSGSKRV